MQPHFQAARRKRIINGCKEQIALAIRRKHAIIVVEYSGYGETQPVLMEMLEDYKKFKVVTKRTDNGSREVYDCLKQNNYTGPIIVCGVNWNACVFATVLGLADKIADDIYVIRQACGNWKGKCDLGQWKNQPNVQVCYEPLQRRIRRTRGKVLQPL